MNENQFISAFGKQRSWDILWALWRFGACTRYKLHSYVSYSSAQQRRNIKETLRELELVGIVKEQEVTRLHCAKGGWNEVTEYSINQLHEIAPALLRLFTEITRPNGRLL
jgi:hypothetical protein